MLFQHPMFLYVNYWGLSNITSLLVHSSYRYNCLYVTADNSFFQDIQLECLMSCTHICKSAFSIQNPHLKSLFSYIKLAFLTNTAHSLHLNWVTVLSVTSPKRAIILPLNCTLKFFSPREHYHCTVLVKVSHKHMKSATGVCTYYHWPSGMYYIQAAYWAKWLLIS